jgi:hypothetical protein
MPDAQPITAAMREQELLENITEMARWLGWRAYHPWRSDHSAAGYPDLTLLRARVGEPPRLIFAELKREGRRPTRDQAAWLADLDRLATYAVALGEPALVSVHLWRPADWCNGAIERVLRGD